MVTTMAEMEMCIENIELGSREQDLATGTMRVNANYTFWGVQKNPKTMEKVEKIFVKE